MKKHASLLWLLGLLAIIALGVETVSAKLDHVSVPAGEPSPKVETAEELNPARFHMHGIGLGTSSMGVHLKWKYLRKTGNWETFGFEKTDATGRPYYFLAAEFDALGSTTILRGTSIGYDGDENSDAWEKLRASNLLPPPIELGESETSGHRLELYPSLGLAAHYLSKDVSEYYLIDPLRWNQFRIDDCDLLRSDKARIFLAPQK